MKKVVFFLAMALCASTLLSCDFDNFCEETEVSMVRVNKESGGYAFYIDAYEASRSNAAPDTAGTGVTLACNYQNTKPWTNVTFEDAFNACADAGKHLCSKSEWLAACNSANGYPYGDDYVKSKCNDSGRLLGTGASAACRTTTGIYDMSGNASEWVTDDSNNGTAWLMGGSYNSTETELKCGSAKMIKDPAKASITDSIGFRCCDDASITP